MKNTIKSVEKILDTLNSEIKDKFEKGIISINNQFNNFFTTMFGGGRASILPVKIKKKDKYGDMVSIDGIDIKIDLPRKNIQNINQLSGGERALTSIALLFAMSQVTPPPFLILDETDSALDEANSKRYGNIVEILSKKSQLILITHNRETMARAGIIYGVTLNKEGASKVLSIQLQEAQKVAK